MPDTGGLENHADPDTQGAAATLSGAGNEGVRVTDETVSATEETTVSATGEPTVRHTRTTTKSETSETPKGDAPDTSKSGTGGDSGS